MDNKDIKKKSKRDTKEKKTDLDMTKKSNDIQNEKENVDSNRVLIEKKKKKKNSINSNKKSMKNIGSIETDSSIYSEMNNNNPNNTYILPPPIPKLKKETKNLPHNNESSLPPSIPNGNSTKAKKSGYTAKIKVHNPIREAETVQLIDGSKEIIFKKYFIILLFYYTYKI